MERRLRVRTVHKGTVVGVIMQRGTVGPGCDDGDIGLEAQTTRVTRTQEGILDDEFRVQRFLESGRGPSLQVRVGRDLRTVTKHLQFVLVLHSPGRIQRRDEGCTVHGVGDERELGVELLHIDRV